LTSRRIAATVTDARADENTLVWFARLDVELYVIHDLTPEPNGYLVPRTAVQPTTRK